MINVPKKKGAGGPLVKQQDLSLTGKERSPVRRCDNCAYSSVCTFYKEGYECAFQEVFDAIDIVSEEDVEKAQMELTTLLVERATFASMMEKMSGAITPEATESLELALKHLDALRRPSREGPKSQTSILAQFFQSPTPQKLDTVSDDVVIDVECTKEDEEKS